MRKSSVSNTAMKNTPPLPDILAEVEGGIFSWGCFGGSGHDPKSTVFPLEITQTCPKSEKNSPAALKSQVIFQEIEGSIFSWHSTDVPILDFHQPLIEKDHR